MHGRGAPRVCAKAQKVDRLGVITKQGTQPLAKYFVVCIIWYLKSEDMGSLRRLHVATR